MYKRNDRVKEINTTGKIAACIPVVNGNTGKAHPINRIKERMELI